MSVGGQLLQVGVPCAVIVLSIAYRVMLDFQLSHFIAILAALAVILVMSYLSFTYIEIKASVFLKGYLRKPRKE